MATVARAAYAAWPASSIDNVRKSYLRVRYCARRARWKTWCTW